MIHRVLTICWRTESLTSPRHQGFTKSAVKCGLLTATGNSELFPSTWIRLPDSTTWELFRKTSRSARKYSVNLQVRCCWRWRCFVKILEFLILASDAVCFDDVLKWSYQIMSSFSISILRFWRVYKLEYSLLISGNLRKICLSRASLVRFPFSVGGRSRTSSTKVLASSRKILFVTFSIL